MTTPTQHLEIFDSLTDTVKEIIQDSKKILNRLEGHDSGEEIIDTSNIERAMEKQEKLTKNVIEK